MELVLLVRSKDRHLGGGKRVDLCLVPTHRGGCRRLTGSIMLVVQLYLMLITHMPYPSR